MSAERKELHFQTQTLIAGMREALSKPEQFPYPAETRQYFQKALKILPTLEGKEGLQETYLLRAQWLLASTPIDTETYYFPSDINALSNDVHECVRRAGKEVSLLDWTGKSTNEQMEIQIRETVANMHFKFAQSSLVELETPLRGFHSSGSIATLEERVHNYLKESGRPYSAFAEDSTDEEQLARIERATEARHLDNAQLGFDRILRIQTPEQIERGFDPLSLVSGVRFDMNYSNAPWQALDPTGQSTDQQMEQRLATEEMRLRELVKRKQSADHALIAAALPDRTHAKKSLLVEATAA